MTIALLIILSTISFLYFMLVWKIVTFRRKITCMAGMMFAMAMGMSVGLFLGTLFGVLYSGNLFLSTVLGMLIGILIGAIPGIPISLMAALDGMLSGVMGGMMGAMIGEMIATDFSDLLIKILFLFVFSTQIILFYILDQEIHTKSKFILKNPLIMAIIVGSFFVGLNQLGPVLPEKKDSYNHEGFSHTHISGNIYLNNTKKV